LACRAYGDFDRRCRVERGYSIDGKAGIKGRIASDCKVASQCGILGLDVSAYIKLLTSRRGDSDINAGTARDRRGSDREVATEQVSSRGLAESRSGRIVQEYLIAGSDSKRRKSRLVGDGTGEQDSAVRLVVQASRRDLLPIGVGFWGLDLSHLFGGLSHLSRDDSLYSHRPD
jgi:hypothetical protein